MKGLLIFAGGVLLAILTVGGIVASQTFFAHADPDLTPKELEIKRASPTAGEITFKTDKEAVARIECATAKTAEFTLCGAETTSTTDHKIRTSMILDPEKEYFFVIKIGNTSFDNLGIPLILPRENDVRTEGSKPPFPTDQIGLCDDMTGFNPEVDINKDGCIRENDRDLYNKD